ncbi:hypothetical protein [uncultured Amphritea sp.]|uniref:hypothetical protein n=1 Tax=uncultured Amphritea sp. TaxID=981605 RepID=UPI0026303AC1|nr:hypothetical protein [uncultured Amphritea sp.]
MSESTVTQLLVDYGQLLDSSMETAVKTLTTAGFDSAVLPPLSQFSFETKPLETKPEPLNGTATLNGRWADTSSQRRGWLVINCDGSMMLEIDLICPWPGKDQLWAESVSVWGSDPQSLRAEVTPLPML